MTKRSPRSGAMCPVSPIVDPVTRAKWNADNDRVNHRVKMTKPQLGALWIASQDPWVGSNEIAEVFHGLIPRPKVRAYRRLTYSKAVTSFIKSAFPQGMTKPAEWYRINASDPAYEMPNAHRQKVRRPCPPMDQLLQQFDAIRVDGRHTAPRPQAGGDSDYFSL